jgi:hypothetical protein
MPANVEALPMELKLACPKTAVAAFPLSVPAANVPFELVEM